MTLASPVPTPVHPVGWRRPAGNLDYAETRDLAEHRRITPGGLGCDFSNGRQGAPVFAMDAGVVYQRYIQNAGGIGDGSLVLRVRHPDGATSGYAHLASFSVNLGARVAKGQKIGVVGATGQGITGPHLHCDYQKPDGVHREVYDLIDTGLGGNDDMTIVNNFPFPEGTRTWTATGGKVTGYKADGSSKSVTLTAGSAAQASGTANIAQNPQKAPNGSGWVLIANGVLAGFFVLPTAGTVAPGPKTYTQADIDKAAKGAAVDVAEEAVEAAQKY